MLGARTRLSLSSHEQIASYHGGQTHENTGETGARLRPVGVVA